MTVPPSTYLITFYNSVLALDCNTNVHILTSSVCSRSKMKVVILIVLALSFSLLFLKYQFVYFFFFLYFAKDNLSPKARIFVQNTFRIAFNALYVIFFFKYLEGLSYPELTDPLLSHEPEVLPTVQQSSMVVITWHVFGCFVPI